MSRGLALPRVVLPQPPFQVIGRADIEPAIPLALQNVHIPHALFPWTMQSPMQSPLDGGEGGIRTHGRVSPTHAFQACSLNRSDTSPICAELFSPFSRGPEQVQSSRKLFHAVEEAGALLPALGCILGGCAAGKLSARLEAAAPG